MKSLHSRLLKFAIAVIGFSFAVIGCANMMDDGPTYWWEDFPDFIQIDYYASYDGTVQDMKDIAKTGKDKDIYWDAKSYVEYNNNKRFGGNYKWCWKSQMFVLRIDKGEYKVFGVSAIDDYKVVYMLGYMWSESLDRYYILDEYFYYTSRYSNATFEELHEELNRVCNIGWSYKDQVEYYNEICTFITRNRYDNVNSY